MIISSSKDLFAISFDTATYQMLSHFVKDHDGYTLARIDPLEFLSTKNFPDGAFINLVIKDFDLREKISFFIDDNDLERFTLIHDFSYVDQTNIGPGCLIYPLAVIYPGAVIHKDVIMHSHSGVAENSQIGAGSFISGDVKICGSSVIGDYCQINVGAIVYDKVTIVSHTIIGAVTIVRKNISVPGTYSSLLKHKIQKIR